MANTARLIPEPPALSPAFDQNQNATPANNTEFSGAGRILILGLPRSGTSWLAKIFDSHPDVFYLHEPDHLYPPVGVLGQFGDFPLDEYLDLGREYLYRLTKVRSLKAAGPLPVFEKHHRSGLARWVRTALIIGMRGAEGVFSNNSCLARIPVPDLVRKQHWGEIRLVIKSVSAAPYARLIMRAWPESRIIIILRNPHGQVASQLRGIEIGKFAAESLGEITRSEEAARLGLKIDQPSVLSTVEQLAWEWAFWNQKMLNDTSDCDRVKVVRYEEFVADSLRMAHDLFEFAHLRWNVRAESFIKRSTTYSGKIRYYGLQRDALRAANSWRSTLSVDDCQRISSMVSRVAIGRTLASLSRRYSD